MAAATPGQEPVEGAHLGAARPHAGRTPGTDACLTCHED